jgi:ribonuclease HII
VARDRLMDEIDCAYPGYGFARHKGYGTDEHLAALAQLGPSQLHRSAFLPVLQAALFEWP